MRRAILLIVLALVHTLIATLDRELQTGRRQTR